MFQPVWTCLKSEAGKKKTEKQMLKTKQSLKDLRIEKGIEGQITGRTGSKVRISGGGKLGKLPPPVGASV